MALSIQEILGQDSPNSGRLKVNTNFNNVKSLIDIHEGYLTSLSGDVVSTDASQTLINKIISSTNATQGAGNSITIAREDFAGDWFGIANSYPGVTVINQKTSQINKTYNTITISGFGGIEPTHDEIKREIGIGFPETAYLNHPDGGVQSLVINADTKLGSAVLDVNGPIVARDKMQLGAPSDGSFGGDTLAISQGTSGGAMDTVLSIETRTAVSDDMSYLSFRKNNNNAPVTSGMSIGAITWAGSINGSAGYNDKSYNTRLEVLSQGTTSASDEKHNMEFWIAPGGGDHIANKIMQIWGGGTGLAGAHVSIGRDTSYTNSAASSLSLLTITSKLSGATTMGLNECHLLLEDDNDPGMVLAAGSSSTGVGTIMWQKGNARKWEMRYKFDAGVERFQMRNSGQQVVMEAEHNGFFKFGGSGTPTHPVTVTGSGGQAIFCDRLSLSSTAQSSLPSAANNLFKLYRYSGDSYIQFGQTDKLKFTDNQDTNNPVLELMAGGVAAQNAATIYSQLDVKGEDFGNGPYRITSRFDEAGSDNHNHGDNRGRAIISATGLGNASESLSILLNDLPAITMYHNSIGSTPEVVIGKSSDDTAPRLGMLHNNNLSAAATTPSSLTVAGNASFGLANSGPGCVPAAGTASSQRSDTDVDGILHFCQSQSYYAEYADARIIAAYDGNNGADGCADGGIIFTTMNPGQGSPESEDESSFGIFGAVTTLSLRYASPDLPRIQVGGKHQDLLNANQEDSTLHVYSQSNDYALTTHGNFYLNKGGSSSNFVDGNLVINGTLQSQGITTGEGDIAITDNTNLSTPGKVAVYVTQTGSGSEPRSAGIQLTREGSSTEGILKVGGIDPADHGSKGDHLRVEMASSMALGLPKGVTNDRPGGSNNTANPIEGDIRYNTTLNHVEVYQPLGNATLAWIPINTPPVGATMIQFGPTGSESSHNPNNLYPGTTWSTGDVPDNYFIRSVGDNNGEGNSNDWKSGAKDYMKTQRGMIGQHTHRSTTTVMPAYWDSGTSGHNDSDWGHVSGSNYWVQDWTDNLLGNSFYDGWNFSYTSNMHNVFNNYGWSHPGDGIELIWEASETFNNGAMDDLRFKGVETGRVVNTTDKRVHWDSTGFDDVAGTGRVTSYGGSNGTGGFWAGYINQNQPFHTGEEVRPINVAVKFWRRTN